MGLLVENGGLNSYDLKRYNFLVMFDTTEIDLWLDDSQIDIIGLEEVDYQFLNN